MLIGACNPMSCPTRRLQANTRAATERFTRAASHDVGANQYTSNRGWASGRQGGGSNYVSKATAKYSRTYARSGSRHAVHPASRSPNLLALAPSYRFLRLQTCPAHRGLAIPAHRLAHSLTPSCGRGRSLARSAVGGAEPRFDDRTPSIGLLQERLRPRHAGRYGNPPPLTFALILPLDLCTIHALLVCCRSGGEGKGESGPTITIPAPL